MADANDSQLIANKKAHDVSRIVEMSDSDSVASLNEDPNEKADGLIKVSISPKNKEQLRKLRYGSLRIDEVPDVNDEEEETDTFLGRSIYKKQKSPASID